MLKLRQVPFLWAPNAERRKPSSVSPICIFSITGGRQRAGGAHSGFSLSCPQRAGVADCSLAILLAIFPGVFRTHFASLLLDVPETETLHLLSTLMRRRILASEDVGMFRLPGVVRYVAR